MLGRHRNRRGDEMWRNRAYVEACRERDEALAELKRNSLWALEAMSDMNSMRPVVDAAVAFCSAPNGRSGGPFMALHDSVRTYQTHAGPGDNLTSASPAAGAIQPALPDACDECPSAIAVDTICELLHGENHSPLYAMAVVDHVGRALTERDAATARAEATESELDGLAREHSEALQHMGDLQARITDLEAQLAQAREPSGCSVGTFSSRMCERGTKGCTVRHEEQPGGGGVPECTCHHGLMAHRYCAVPGHKDAHPSQALVMARDGDVEVLRGRFDLARRRGYPSDKCGTAPIENAMARATITAAGPWVELVKQLHFMFAEMRAAPFGRWPKQIGAVRRALDALPEVKS